MIERMRHETRTVRAPAAHRAVAALVSPVVGYFVARLVIRLTGLPEVPAYAVCLALALVLAVRTWQARVDLAGTDLRIHNTLVSSTMPCAKVHRVVESGRIEWRGRRPNQFNRAPAEALHRPWWTLGSGSATYARNREEVRSWLRAAASEAAEAEAA